MAITGISGISAAFPTRRLSVAETVDNWKNSSTEFIHGRLCVTRRAVLASDEDVLTLSAEASKRCLKYGNKTGDDIDAVFFGSTTGCELHRGSSNSLMDILTDRTEYFAADVAAAERSGTASLLLAMAMVSGGMTTQALVVGADTVNRHTAPGDLRESYAGAGAAACLVGSDPLLLLEGTASINSNFPNFGRPEDERFTRSLMPVDLGTTALGLLQHTTTAVQLFCKNNAASLEDFDAFVLPQAFPGQSLIVAKTLGIPFEKVTDSLFAGEIGDTGAASVLIGLAKVLESIQPQQRILVCSYGSNAGADVLAFQTTDAVVPYQTHARGQITRLIENKTDVGYAEALRLEHKLASPNITLGAFN